MTDEIETTELLEIEAERVDAVGNPANGTEWLLLKSVDKSPATFAPLSKQAEYEYKSAIATDPVLAMGYLELADELREP